MPSVTAETTELITALVTAGATGLATTS